MCLYAGKGKLIHIANDVTDISIDSVDIIIILSAEDKLVCIIT